MEKFIEGNILFSVNFHTRKCPEMRNHAKNLASGNMYAVFAAAIFSAAQAPRSLTSTIVPGTSTTPMGPTPSSATV